MILTNKYVAPLEMLNMRNSAIEGEARMNFYIGNTGGKGLRFHENGFSRLQK